MTFANIMREKGFEPSCPLWAPDPKSGTDPPTPVAQQGGHRTALYGSAGNSTRRATSHVTWRPTPSRWSRLAPFVIGGCLAGGVSRGGVRPMSAPYYSDSLVTIYHGDSLLVIPQLEGIGAVVTDPPYSSGGAFRGDRMASTVSKYVNSDTAAYRPEFAGDNRDQRAFAAWCTLWMNAARSVSLPGAVMASFIDWRQLPTLTDAVQGGGWIWRGVATWWKPGIRMQRARFSSSAEYIVYATNGEVIDHDGAPQNVFRCAPAPDKQHVAEKPLQVMHWVLGAVPPSALVLDPFMGSGTTLHAARDLGYRSIGIDSDERYCEMAARRLDQGALDLGGAA